MFKYIFPFLFALSLLNIFLRFFIEYSNQILWKASVLTSEYGHFLAALTFAIWFGTLMFGDWRLHPRYRKWMVLITIAFFCYPVASAVFYQSKWRLELQTAFGGTASSRLKWIDWNELAIFHEPSVPTAFKTFSYRIATADDTAMTLDYYQGREHAPLILIVHGGGWQSGDSQQLPELNLKLTNLGYNVASVNYSLIPKKIWPSQKSDIIDAIIWLKNNRGNLRFDDQKIVLLGRSAGGHLAAIVANQRRDLGIVGLISYYAPSDLAFGFDVAQDNDVIDSRNLIRMLHGGDAFQKPLVFEDTSVLKAVSPNSPPTLIIHGGSDTLVWYKHSERWDRALDAAHVKHYFLKLPWATHGFDYNLHGPGGQIATNAVLYFLKELVPVPPQT